jgi:hypothetical protein
MFPFLLNSLANTLDELVLYSDWQHFIQSFLNRQSCPIAQAQVILPIRLAPVLRSVKFVLIGCPSVYCMNWQTKHGASQLIDHIYVY